MRKSQVIAHSVKDPADFTIVGISADIKRVREDSMKNIAIVTGASRGIGRERSTRQRFTVFTLSGRMEAAQVPELKDLFDRDYRNIIPDLRDPAVKARMFHARVALHRMPLLQSAGRSVRANAG